MPKRIYKMRWSDSDKTELNRVLKNFNAKIARVEKSHPEWAEYLPERARKADVMARIETRADFNRVMNMYKRFSRRGAEAPFKSSRSAKITEWAKNEIKIMDRLDKARRARERKAVYDTPRTFGGEVIGAGRHGDPKDADIADLTFNPDNMSQKEFEKAFSYLDSMLGDKSRKKRLEDMRENYIKGLQNSDMLIALPDLEKWVRGLDLEEFYKITQTDEAATFDFYNDPIEFYNRIGATRDAWLKPYAEKMRKEYKKVIGKEGGDKTFNTWLNNSEYDEFYYYAKDTKPKDLYRHWSSFNEGFDT